MSPFKFVGKGGGRGCSVQSTTGRRAVHISLQGLYCSCEPLFCSHVTLTDYTLHSLVSPSLLQPCVIVWHHISNAVYQLYRAGLDGVEKPSPNRPSCNESLYRLRNTGPTSPVLQEIASICEVVRHETCHMHLRQTTIMDDNWHKSTEESAGSRT
jgi:hypothetical protein